MAQLIWNRFVLILRQGLCFFSRYDSIHSANGYTAARVRKPPSSMCSRVKKRLVVTLGGFLKISCLLLNCSEAQSQAATQCEPRALPLNVNPASTLTDCQVLPAARSLIHPA